MEFDEICACTYAEWAEMQLIWGENLGNFQDPDFVEETERKIEEEDYEIPF